jgi:hypothetical protein
MAALAPDRLELLLAQHQVTGIDFVYVLPDQVTLDVFFLRAPGTLAVPLVGGLTPEQIRITSTGAGVPLVPVAALAWVVVDGHDALRLTTAFPGGFARYRLRIDDPRLDPFLDEVAFTFKANCPSDLDCEPPPHVCPPEDEVDFPVDYRARDFWSFRQALLDFASQRYPDWQDRLEADAGVMLAEVLSALGDELAYIQDRVGREAWLETATQRRSLRRHARLVDYDVHDGLGATAWLDLDVAAAGVIPAGADVWAFSDDGSRVPFEVGRGLLDGKAYPVDPARNRLLPHLRGEEDVCLPVGTTELYLKGHQAATLPFDDILPDPAADPGKWVLLQTNPEPGITPRALAVRLIEILDESDPLVDDPVTLHDVTRVRWEATQATPFEMDQTVLEVRANLVPATAGRTHERHFVIAPEKGLTEDALQALSDLVEAAFGRPADQPAGPLVETAIERTGPNGTRTFLFTLPDRDDEGLVWRGDDPRTAKPEVALAELELVAGVLTPEEPWACRRTSVGSNAAQAGDRHVTLDDGTWQRVVGYWRNGAEVVHRDYAHGRGRTLRFGDGVFGTIPPEGTLFRVRYRLGNGRRSNLPPRALTQIGPLPFPAAVTNPLPAAGGVDPETAAEVRQLAPEAFRAVTYRAVRPEDYAEAAERLPWVQRAGASFRWTGSWLTLFATPDPRDAVTVAPAQRAELEAQLDRFRQAGREVHVLDPVYANLDLRITVCAEPSSFPGDVEEMVLEALLGRRGVRRRPGFFSPDNFTFGTPLGRAALEATIQRVPGVRAVRAIRIRRRGWFGWRPFGELVYAVAPQEVIRVENDPAYPERGSLRIDMEGGA